MFPWYSDRWSTSQAMAVEKNRIRKKGNKILDCMLLWYTVVTCTECDIRRLSNGVLQAMFIGGLSAVYIGVGTT